MSENPTKHDHQDLKFPDNFLWGAATSAHQVEGNNINSDWWQWEQNIQPEEKRSGQAANQYQLYEQDFDLIKSLGHNAHRLSIEWARIEPQEGKFDQSQIEHYVKVLKYLKSLNLKVVLTLWHFTNPLWFTKKGGWENFKAPIFFERFVKKIVPEIKDYVDLWITINEPGVYSWMSYGIGSWPPQKKSKFTSLKVLWNMARAHKKAYKTIHNLVNKPQVGIAKEVFSFDAMHHHSFLEVCVEMFADLISNHLFYKFTGLKTHDFLGLNYYLNQYISFNGNSKLPTLIDISPSKKDVSDMGWEVHPEGIFDILVDFSDYHKPIYITENGIASNNDDRRVRFLLSYIKEVYHAISFGVDVRGYFYWSLIDNFEWAWGYDPRFGLIEVDYKTQKRTPRPSAYVYSDIIEHNGIPHHVLKLLGHGIDVEDALEIIKDPNCKDCKIKINVKG